MRKILLEKPVQTHFTKKQLGQYWQNIMRFYGIVINCTPLSRYWHLNRNLSHNDNKCEHILELLRKLFISSKPDTKISQYTTLHRLSFKYIAKFFEIFNRNMATL